MEEENKDIKLKIIVGVIIALMVCAFIPYSYWSTKIVSGRLVSEGTIVDRSEGSIVVRLHAMTESRDMVETGTFLLLEGNVPEDTYMGQRVRIGYSSSEGLYANPNQMVQVSYFVEGTVLSGLLDWVLPTPVSKTDLQIADIQSDGSLLAYNRAA